MDKKKIGTLITFVFGLSCCAFASLPVKKIYLKGICVDAEIASQAVDREKGLMFRDSLEEGKGMLFIFENTNEYSFWMKNMRFPIDIIWLSEDKEVIDLTQNLLPCNEFCPAVTPTRGVKFVLEVTAGFVQRNDVKIGDKAKF